MHRVVHLLPGDGLAVGVEAARPLQGLLMHGDGGFCCFGLRFNGLQDEAMLGQAMNFCHLRDAGLQLVGESDSGGHGA